MSDTGLPELLEGYFWRVTDWQGDLMRENVVQLRRKSWFGSALIMEQHVHATLSPESIARAAELIMARREAEARKLSLMGDYPPGRLGDA